ncbi:hypothetical protein E4U55_002480 [Claviceps digitariae]|nr:hypothetical protein E4U55_002480 [Claviceps digitariae]
MDMYPDRPVILNRRSEGSPGLVGECAEQHPIHSYSSRRYYLLFLLIRNDRLHYRVHWAKRDKVVRQARRQTWAGRGTMRTVVRARDSLASCRDVEEEEEEDEDEEERRGDHE